MRVALVEVIASLIRELATSDDLTSDSSQSQRKLNSFYDLLLERALDVSSYVRSKVFSVLSRLCDLPVKFPKQRLAMTRAAVDALEDKAASVRKAAVILLVKLVVTHPYGLMHGGLLGLNEWEERYQKVKEELEKVEETVGKVVENDADADHSGTETEKNTETEDEQDYDEDDETVGRGSTNSTPFKTPRRYDGRHKHINPHL